MRAEHPSLRTYARQGVSLQQLYSGAHDPPHGREPPRGAGHAHPLGRGLRAASCAPHHSDSTDRADAAHRVQHVRGCVLSVRARRCTATGFWPEPTRTLPPALASRASALPTADCACPSASHARRPGVAAQGIKVGSRLAVVVDDLLSIGGDDPRDPAVRPPPLAKREHGQALGVHHRDVGGACVSYVAARAVVAPRGVGQVDVIGSKEVRAHGWDPLRAGAATRGPFSCIHHVPTATRKKPGAPTTRWAPGSPGGGSAGIRTRRFGWEVGRGCRNHDIVSVGMPTKGLRRHTVIVLHLDPLNSTLSCILVPAMYPRRTRRSR